MICKNCGTESRGRYCSHCGAWLFEGADMNNDLPEHLEVTEQPEQIFCPERIECIEQPEPEPEPEQPMPRISREERCRQELGFFKVFWPALMMLLPLAYFFVDVFVRLSDLLFAVDATGKSLLSVFLERLSSAEYALNSMQEIKLLTFGTEEALYQTVSLKQIWVAGDLQLPLIIVLAISLACAVCGLLTLITGGKLLTKRIFLDLTALVGYAAAFSPLLALAVYRAIAFFWAGAGEVGLRYADAAMQPLSLSVESVLLVGVMICVLLPNVHALRTMGARARDERIHVALPYTLLTGRSFFLTRVLALAFTVAALALAVVQHAFPVLVTGEALDVVGAWNAFYADSAEFVSAIWHIITAQSAAVDFQALTAMLLKLVLFLQVPLLAIVILSLVLPFVRVLFAKRKKLARKKWACRSIERIGARTRRAVLMAFWCYAFAQMLLILLLLFGSKLVLHLNISNIPETLSLVYLLAGNIKMLCGTNTLFSIWALAGVMLSHLAGNMACKMILLSHKAQFEK